MASLIRQEIIKVVERQLLGHNPHTSKKGLQTSTFDFLQSNELLKKNFYSSLRCSSCSVEWGIVEFLEEIDEAFIICENCGYIEITQDDYTYYELDLKNLFQRISNDFGLFGNVKIDKESKKISLGYAIIKERRIDIEVVLKATSESSNFQIPLIPDDSDNLPLEAFLKHTWGGNKGFFTKSISKENIYFDKDSGILYYNDQLVVRTTPTSNEYKFLLKLWERRNKPISHEELQKYIKPDSSQTSQAFCQKLKNKLKTMASSSEILEKVIQSTKNKNGSNSYILITSQVET
jgi:hypothetical protein